jgi:nuclear pore complex protein Nup188
LLELSSCLPKNENLSKQMLQVAQQCLTANLSGQGPENIFVRITEARANFALTLVQRLASSPPSANDINQLLGTLFGVVNSIEEPFAPDSTSYYRTLLKILYVILRAYTESEKKLASGGKSGQGDAAITLAQTVLSLLDRVVAKGFRQLVSLVHDPEASVSPDDLNLLTAILQACLAMPNMDQCQDQIQNIMANYDVIHTASSLFSWADKLVINGDPIYGELSLMFLLELSTLPRLAEQMATDGLLSHLLSANLANAMRLPIISPFSDSSGPQRCYNIWAKGLLPLLLNMLTALNGTVASEIATVLNQFPYLLRSSIERFEAPGASRTASRDAPHYLALVTVSEVHSLALLAKVIAAFRANNGRDIIEVQWDGTALLENVDFWLSSRKLLRERLVPTGARELEWKNTKVGPPSEAENQLEARFVAQLEAVRDVLAEDLES